MFVKNPHWSRILTFRMENKLSFEDAAKIINRDSRYWCDCEANRKKMEIEEWELFCVEMEKRAVARRIENGTFGERKKVRRGTYGFRGLELGERWILCTTNDRLHRNAVSSAHRHEKSGLGALEWHNTRQGHLIFTRIA